VADQLSQRRGAPRARNLELALTLLVLGGGLPAVILAGIYLITQPHPSEVRWTLIVIVIGVWIVAASAARQLAMRSLNLIANLLGALREGDYSIRGLSAKSGSSMSMVMREVNDLGSTLQRQQATPTPSHGGRYSSAGA